MAGGAEVGAVAAAAFDDERRAPVLERLPFGPERPSMTDHAHHDHHGHDHHAHVDAGNERRVLWALLLTGGFMLAEVAGGLLSGSLALLADAGHMLTDTAALALSWYAFRAARRPATPARSYGHGRIQVLAALINSGALVVIAVWITVEAGRRLLAPAPVLGGPMLAVAALGLVVNIAAFLILHRGDETNLNMRGAALHVLGDLLGSLGAILAAVVILWTGWTPIDPILSVLVALLILRGAWSNLVRAWHVLMEGTPEELDVGSLRVELAASVPGVLDVHHVHAWSLLPGRTLMTLHASIAAEADHDTVLHDLQHALEGRFGIAHATIQLERNHCTDRPHGAGAASASACHRAEA
jgi:cobalt-zinc-cadmium efflux system protein